MAISSNDKGLTDNELLHLYQNDKNNSALSILFERYKPLIIARIKAFNIPALDFDDVMQECMVVLFTAINSYNNQIASFNTYVSVCINRALISMYRQNKNDIEVFQFDFNEDEKFLIDAETPQIIIENNFDFLTLVDAVKSSLSKLEFSVLRCLFNGLKYSEIAKTLSVTTKTVDNAVQRIRNKFNKI